MNCPSCGHANRDGAKFCEECASSLRKVCASCGSELRPTAKFCDECAEPVSAPQPAAEPAGARKIVSILFADLVGSTGLHERLDPESARRFMESYYAAARHAVQSNGGTVTQFLGDGVKAVFGIPRVAEDDAIRAVRAGVAMQEAFQALAEQQRGAVGETGLRVAVNTGEVVAKGETEIIGDPVNVAARLQERGQDGDVVIGESTQRLVASQVSLELLGSFDLKGRAVAVKAYRVVSLDAPGRAAAEAFVGREDELARITAVYDRAVDGPATHLAVLLGSPGLGKSRLIGEFARRTGATATVIEARCDAARGATFAPIADAVRELLDIEAAASAEEMQRAIEGAIPDDDTERVRIAAGIVALLGGSPGAPEETFFVVRRFLAALAATHPVVLAVDDLQWAEPLLLDLVEHLVQWGRDLPLLLLIGARPELRDLRSSFAMQGGLVAELLTLDGLDATAAMRLAAGVIGAEDLPAAVAAKVLATSEGNPLFIGELIRMLVDEGAITRDGDRWVAGAALATVEMPPTIHALLSARIERLEPLDCSILERAAVVGRHFSRSAVAALLAGGEADLDARIESLQRAELIERDTGWLLGEPVLRFHHVLIRDAAYRRLLKGTRAELHEQHANWIEAKVGDAPEHDEMIGRHLEEAHRLLGELGPIDEAGQVLGDRAGARLASAGRRALEGDDVPLAAGLLGRAFDRLRADDPSRADLALDWCEALLAAGDVTRAAEAIDELGRLVQDSERLRAWHTCFVGQQTVLTAPEELLATVDGVAAAAKSLASLDDAAGEAKGHYVHALALSRLGQVGACEASLDQALAAARRAGDRRQANTVLAIAPLAALWGPSPVTRASGRCLDVVRVLRITQGAPAVEAVALSCQGVLEALRGRTEAAHRMIASGREMVEELGITQRLLEADVFAGFVALLENDVPTAERKLRGAYDDLRELGHGIDAARAAALLARALLAQDRVEEAEALSHESEALAGDDLKAAIAWRGVRAEALAKRGEHAEAIEFAQAAVQIAASTDALLDHADARRSLSVALRAAGQERYAANEEECARQLCEDKGATFMLVPGPETGAGDALDSGSPAGAVAPSGTGEPYRPVRANAAAEAARRMEAAFAARDFAAARACYADDYAEIHHPTGATFDADASVASGERLFRSRDPFLEVTPVATLGSSLALVRRRSGAHGSAGERYDVGAYDNDVFDVFETDGQGRLRRAEVFATERLGDAIVRLYEWYAEAVRDGPLHSRIAQTARSARAWQTPFDLAVFRPVLDAHIEAIDHRVLGTWSAHGVEAMLDHIRALHEVASNAEMQDEEILALESDAFLVRRVHSGAESVGGGAYERAFLLLVGFGADGLMSGYEFFEVSDEAPALARFEELTASSVERPATQPRPPEVATPTSLPGQGRRGPSWPRVRPNAASEAGRRFEATLIARDFDAARALFADGYTEINHPTGSSLDAEAPVGSVKRLFRSREPYFSMTPLATLGASLALVLRRSGASAVGGERYDVGAYENNALHVFETDEQGRQKRAEVFAVERLGDAIVRLYEWYSQQFPDGSERIRARRAAKSVLAWLRPFDLEIRDPALDPAMELVDHRTLGTWIASGVDAVLEQVHAVREVADTPELRYEEILALEPGALLTRTTHAGIERVGGGVYERPYLVILGFGNEGRLCLHEAFDLGDEARALARFDEETGGPVEPGAPQPLPRRFVRPNAATRLSDGFLRTIRARDAAALRGLLSTNLEFEHRPTSARYGAREFMTAWRSILKAERVGFDLEVIASLGDRFALQRHRLEIEGLSESSLSDFGRAEFEEIVVVEADASGKCCRIDLFEAEKLGAAIACFYERYAESLPEGRERTHAMATARGVAAWMGPIALDRLEPALAPSALLVDHRVLATWSSANGAELLEHFWVQLELAPDFAVRIEDVVALERDVYLLQANYHGTDRASGGRFENRVCLLCMFDADGLASRFEAFEAEDEAGALARFDELTGRPEAEPTPEPLENAASRADAKLFQCFNSRNWAGIEALAAPELVFDERRRMLHNTCGREIWLEQFRVLFDVPASRFSTTLRATRGERLSLNLHRFTGEVAGGGGPLEMDDHLVLHEVDREGRIIAIVLFDLEAKEAAHEELDARWAAGEAHEYPSVSDWIARFRESFAARDWDAMSALSAPDSVAANHRLVGWGTLRGHAAWVPTLEALVALAPNAKFRLDHLRTSARGFVWSCAWHGERDGGPFETPFVLACELDAAGLERRFDVWEVDDLDKARARFAELTDDAAASNDASLFANTAYRANAELLLCFNARDLAGVEACLSPSLVFDDRRPLRRLAVDVDGFMTQFRFLLDVPGSRFEQRLLATRGTRLSLSPVTFRGSVAEGGGPLDWDEDLLLAEIDQDGRLTSIVLFASDDVGPAFAELDTRFAAGEGAGPSSGRAAFVAFERAVRLGEWDTLVALCADDLVEYDHRSLAVLGTTRGAEAWVRSIRMMGDLAPGTVYRGHHFISKPRGYFVQGEWTGTHEGGPYEIPLNAVVEIDERGRMVRIDIYDDTGIEPALARLEELDILPAESSFRFANAATRASERIMHAWATRDWDALAAAHAPSLRVDDRRPLMKMDLPAGDAMDALRFLFDVPQSRVSITPLATRGEHLALSRYVFEGLAGADGGAVEIEALLVARANAADQIVETVSFDPDDFSAAYALLDARYEEGDRAAESAGWVSLRDFVRCVDRRDWDGVVALCGEQFIEFDQRGFAVLGTTVGADSWVENFREIVRLAPDTVYRAHHLLTEARGYYVHGGWFGTRAGGGDYELVVNAVLELDDRGRMVRADMYDDEGFDAARARLAELVAPFENTTTRRIDKHVKAWVDKDWERFADLFPPDFHLSDRRATVQLELGRDEAIAFSRHLGELPHASIETQTIAVRGERLALQHWHTELSGQDVGPSEIDHLNVFQTDERGAVVALVRWDVNDLALAWAELDARFAASEGAKGHRSESQGAEAPSLAPTSTAAERAAGRWGDAYRAGAETGNWEPLREVCAPEFLFADRRRMTLVEGDLETMFASVRERARTGARAEEDLVATVCDRIRVTRVLVSGGPADGRFEIEYLSVLECDEVGRCSAIILFDVEDTHGAQRQAWARWAAIEPDRTAAVTALVEIVDAFTAKDPARLRAAYADDLVVEDHRLAGMGRLEGVDAYLASFAALWEIAPRSVGSLDWEWPAIERHGAIGLVRRSGAVEGGGGDYESVSYAIHLVSGGLVTRVEMFEMLALDQALARFEELRPDPLEIPPNAATRFIDRLRSVGIESAVDAIREMAADDFRFEDRKKNSLVSGGVEEWLRSLTFLRAEALGRSDVRRVATAGEYLALQHASWRDTADESRFEIEHYHLLELDAAGKLRAFILFDVDDRAAASEELFDRYIAMGADGMPQEAIEFAAGVNEHDLVRARTGLCDDFVLVDHRWTGMGQVDGADAYIESVRVMQELLVQSRTEVLHSPRVTRNGRVSLVRTWGENTEGGPVEIRLINLQMYRDGKIARFEFFELEDLEAALARFEELRPERMQ